MFPQYFAHAIKSLNPEDLIAYETSLYPGEPFNVAVYYLYSHLRKANRS